VWNPTAVAWLGLLFTPLWSATLAALNARRLQLPLPWWRPLAIAGGGIFLDVFLNGLFLDSYLVSLLLYLLAAGLIAYLDLLPQRQAYESACRAGRPHQRWALQLLAGSPLGLLVIVGFVIVPLHSLFRPLTPREVCERFARADEVKDVEGMNRYSTMNMREAVLASTKLPVAEGDRAYYEFTEEGPPPDAPDTYLVAFRLFSTQGGKRSKLEGVYHLVQRYNAWKVEDVYLVSVDGQALPHWVAVSEALPQFVRQTEGTSGKRSLADLKTQQESSRAAKGETAWTASRRVAAQEATKHGVNWLFSPSGQARLLAIFGFIAGGVSALWRRLKGQKGTTLTCTGGQQGGSQPASPTRIGQL
jgi:hypothetical protein